MTDNKFEELLEEFSNLPKWSPQNENFFSICGFPHYEVVASKVLSFFLDTTREHGFKNMLVKSLMEAVNSRPEHEGFFDDDALHTVEFTSEIEIPTEKTPTENTKFIDILLESETLNIAIENKIGADLYNRLDLYHKRATQSESGKNSKENKKPAKVVVLGLNEIDETNKYKKEKHKNYYAFITYNDLFAHLKRNIGEYIQYANPRYTQFLMEFINNIENLKETKKMNKEFAEFLKNNYESAKALKQEFKDFEASQHKAADSVNELIKAKQEQNLANEKIKVWKYRDDEPFSYIAITTCFCGDEKLEIAIDAYISYDGWSFQVILQEKDKNRISKTEEYIKEHLNAFELIQSKNNRLNIYENGEPKTFPIDTSEEEIAEFISTKLINSLINK